MLSVTTPELLESGRYTADGVALLSSVNMIFYAGGQLVNGFLGDMLSPKLMILGGIGLGGASMIIFPFLPFQALRVICFALLGFGLSMVRGPLMKIISENTEAKHARLICVFFSFASFAGPLIASLFVMAFAANLLFGSLMTRVGWSVVLLVWASVGIIGLITTLFAHKLKN